MSSDLILETQGGYGGILRQGIRFGVLNDHSGNSVDEGLDGKTTIEGRIEIVQVRKGGGLNYWQESCQVRTDL